MRDLEAHFISRTFAREAALVSRVSPVLRFNRNRRVLATAQHEAGRDEIRPFDVGGMIAEAIGAANRVLLVPGQVSHNRGMRDLGSDAEELIVAGMGAEFAAAVAVLR
jgi:hypothetical protein